MPQEDPENDQQDTILHLPKWVPIRTPKPEPPRAQPRNYKDYKGNKDYKENKESNETTRKLTNGEKLKRAFPPDVIALLGILTTIIIISLVNSN